MSTPNGYNNPAYCHQYDSSLYEYQYVPEIDPDSPDLHDEGNRRVNQTKLVHPNVANFQNDSSEFEGSDESNPSIIVEECNNRRVTLICEKRSKAEVGKDGFYEEENFDGAYYQDISLESENAFGSREVKSYYSPRKAEVRGSRYGRTLKATGEEDIRSFNVATDDKKISHNPSFKQSSASINSQRTQRYHRYEEIQSDEESQEESHPRTAHRYAEITADENGYPTLSKEIKIQTTKENYRQRESQKIHKPRAISPVSYPKSFSPPVTPSRTNQRFNFSPVPTSPIIYSSSPVKSDSFEMSELSPPKTSEIERRSHEHAFFIRSPKRQPPIGASAANDPREPYAGKCILPKNLQKINKSGKRPQSLPNSPRRQIPQTSECKPQSERKITQIFHIKTKPKNIPQKENTPARRNISHAFADYPTECRNVQMAARSPYKSTTTELPPPRTAIITPILQRKNQEQSFAKTSQAFQSTGNLYKNSIPQPQQERVTSPNRIKRNRSVPNFSQSLAAESRMMARAREEQENQKYSRNLDFQYSPKKPIEHVTSIDKSRISLMDQTSSWSTLDSEYQRRCSTCFIFAALVHLVTASATCAISFYLLSKVGRKYYLDFGLLAGFVNFILGLLGFRSYCWRWLPNRNYTSGFIGLAAFSAFTCAGLTYLITAKPMAGDPILDIMGGAICAVSVLTIFLALTGLTMSGCCKAPPPDNRVTDI